MLLSITISMILNLFLIKPIHLVELDDLSTFFRYKYDENCTYKNLRPDGIVLTNDTNGLVFFGSKVWKTKGFKIVDPKYRHLKNVYPELNDHSSIDSVFTLFDSKKMIRYCFIIQDSTYFLYLTQQTAPNFKHNQFTRQLYLGKFKLNQLISSKNYTNLFIKPIYCSLILPIENETYLFFFFGYYTKYLTCEVRLEYRRLDQSRPADLLTNQIPFFNMNKECEILEQDQSHKEQECRFLVSMRSNSTDKATNSILLGQRSSVYFNTNLNYTNFFDELFKGKIKYRDIWNCEEISYRNYNIIKFLIVPLFLIFTSSFILLTKLFNKNEEFLPKTVSKLTRIKKVYQKIRAENLQKQISRLEPRK